MRRIGIIGTTVLIAVLCGIGIFHIQEYPFQEMPAAFVQAQSDIIEMTYADHGKLLLTADSEGNITFWNTASKKQVGQLNGVGYLVRANENGTLVLFSDWTRQTPVQKWPRVSHITLLRFPATDSPSSELQYDVEKWTTSGMIINSLPDLSRLLTFGATNTLALIDQHGKVLSRRSFSKDADGIDYAKFSWDGKYLLAPDLEHSSYVLNATDLSIFRKLPPLNQVAISNDNQYIAGISWDGRFQSWNIKTQKQITKKTLYSHCILIYPHDDNHFLIYGLTGDDKHWNDASGIFAADGTFIQKKNKNVYQPLYNGQKWRIISYGFESGSAYYVGAKTPYADVIDLSKNEIVHRLNTVTDILGNERAWNGSGPDGISKYAIASDGSRAAVVTPGNMIRFYDFNAQRAAQPVLYKSNSGGRVVYPDDSELSTDKRSNDLRDYGYTILDDGSVMVRSPERRVRIANKYELGQKMRRNGHIYWLANISYSPKRTKVLLFLVPDFEEEKKEGIKKTWGQDGALNYLFEIRSVDDNRLIHQLRTPQNLHQGIGNGNPTWSSDGKKIALTNSGGCIFVYDAESGRQIAYLSGASSQRQLKNWWHDDIPGGATSLAISPDDKYVAVSRGDGTIYLYSLKTQLPVAQIGQISGGAGRLQFSADGHSLYGITNYQQVRAWNVPEINL